MSQTLTLDACRDHPARATVTDFSAPWIPCGLCALWLTTREDAIGGPEDAGICPRRLWPRNRTHGTDGCRHGVPVAG